MSKHSHNRALKVLIIIGLVGLGHISGKLADRDILNYNSYSIYARFDSVAGLEVGYPVKMHGLKIGRVTDLQIDQDKQVALAKLAIEDDILIYDDAFASIRMGGLMGKNYLSIDPGGSGDILQSDEIIIETEALIELSTIISKYAFGDLTPNSNDNPVRFAFNKKQDPSEWLERID